LPQNASLSYTLNKCDPVWPQDARTMSVRFAPNIFLAAGQLLSQISLVAVNAVQTLTGAGTWTSGTFTLTYNGQTTAAIPFNATAAQVQTALGLLTNIGPGQVTCTGGPLSGTPVLVTFGGMLAGLPIALMSASTANIVGGGTLTPSTSTVGVAGGRYKAYASTAIAAPTVAPVLTDGAVGTWPAGEYTGSYTYVNSVGETTVSPDTAYLSAGTKKVHFAALAGIPAGVTFVNLYINGQYAKQIAVTANATAAQDVDLADVATVAAHPAPSINTAFSNLDGSQNFKLINAYDLNTDAFGNIIYGGSTQLTPEQGTFTTGEAFYRGAFKGVDLVGLDAWALAQANVQIVAGSLPSDAGLIIALG